MKRIWAPWRMEYILQPKSKGCFLCEGFTDDQDRDRLILRRGTHCAIMMNRYPYNNGHLMVAPLRHIDRLEELTDSESAELMHFTQASIRVLRQYMKPDGFNVGLNLGEAAGAGLKEHLHQHIVPRWSGDTNFMPAIGETKVMPQSLGDVYEGLLPLFVQAL